MIEVLDDALCSVYFWLNPNILVSYEHKVCNRLKNGSHYENHFIDLYFNAIEKVITASIGIHSPKSRINIHFLLSS